MTWISRFAPAVVAVAMLAGCTSSNPNSNSSSGSSSNSGNCNGTCVLFHEQFNFTGQDNIQGSFVDTSSGTGFSSCAEWAKGDSVGFVQGPGTNNPTVIGGKDITYLFIVSKDKFRGPGTYSGTLAAGVSIGPDTFLTSGQGDSSETLNADGSGHGSFTNLYGVSQGSESGTVTWTCSQ